MVISPRSWNRSILSICSEYSISITRTCIRNIVPIQYSSSSTCSKSAYNLTIQIYISIHMEFRIWSTCTNTNISSTQSGNRTICKEYCSRSKVISKWTKCIISTILNSRIGRKEIEISSIISPKRSIIPLYHTKSIGIGRSYFSCNLKFC